MAASELPEPTKAPIGVAKVEHLSWKAVLDFYTCTECGRCSDNCPAHKTGKILSPKHLTLALRDHMYEHESELAEREMAWGPGLEGAAAEGAAEADGRDDPRASSPTRAGAPSSRRSTRRSISSPRSSTRTCSGPARRAAPARSSARCSSRTSTRSSTCAATSSWSKASSRTSSRSRSRAWRSTATRGTSRAWIAPRGPTASTSRRSPRSPTPQVLYWVGCAASYDDRAKKIARATARLMKAAGVDFAILGQEESCTGDPARRAGNELLFAMLAEGNAAVLNTYKEQGGMKTGRDGLPALLQHAEERVPGLRREARGRPPHGLPPRPPRREASSHPKKAVSRARRLSRQLLPRPLQRHLRVAARDPEARSRASSSSSPTTGTRRAASAAAPAARRCAMEEQNTNRVNVKRTLQLVDTGAKTVASACPFCMTMLTDGLKSQNLEDTDQADGRRRAPRPELRGRREARGRPGGRAPKSSKPSRPSEPGVTRQGERRSGRPRATPHRGSRGRRCRGSGEGRPEPSLRTAMAYVAPGTLTMRGLGDHAFERAGLVGERDRPARYGPRPRPPREPLVGEPTADRARRLRARQQREEPAHARGGRPSRAMNGDRAA